MLLEAPPLFLGGPQFFASSRRIQPWMRARRILASKFPVQREQRAEKKSKKNPILQACEVRGARLWNPRRVTLGRGQVPVVEVNGRPGRQRFTLCLPGSLRHVLCLCIVHTIKLPRKIPTHRLPY